MCLTEQEMTSESIAITICEEGSWGCFCGYHDHLVDREPTHEEVLEMRRRRSETPHRMSDFAIAYERDHESFT